MAATAANNADWDYIIVGAGSAGCVLANRLTQDGHFRVLLLEGGGEDRSPYIRVPVETQAVVTRVIIERDRAAGVEYRQGGTLRTARARREVLLSAGALASPKLLMLSGIGPEEELQPHRIAVTVPSPGVGQNLQEHIWATVMCTVNVPSLNMETSPKAIARHGLNFVVRGRGAVATPAAHAILFGQLHSEGDRPDYEMAFAPFGMSGDVVNSIDPVSSASTAPSTEYRHDVNHMRLMSVATISLMPSVSHPKQRGTVGLRSADPADGPRIVHQLLGHPDDLQTLIAACRRARDIAASDALRPYVTGELMPGPKVQTDDEWIDYFRTYAYRGEHPAGTCRMGTDKLAVVDPQLKVHGVEGLRVVDTSVMPTLTTGHTNAPTIMIAERASDFIRADANAR